MSLNNVSHYWNSPLADVFLKQKTDWRFPNELGLSERTLDCRQLSVMEVLKWKGETSIVETFLSPFNCRIEGLSLRRKEAGLGFGWHVVPSSPIIGTKISETIRAKIDQESYCLIYYNPFYMPFSQYYRTHNLTHWSLVYKYDEKQITLADTAGRTSYFAGNIGDIPWSDFIDAWESAPNGGVAILRKNDQNMNWNQQFYHIIEESVVSIIVNKEGEELKQWIETIQNTPLNTVVSKLEKFEFDVNYYRKLRELWLLAVYKRLIPKPYLKYGWAEGLVDLCKSWSLVVGTIMKWKRQPDKDYRKRLLDYLWETYTYETIFFKELEKLLEVRA